MKYELFSRQAIPKILFVLHSRYPWDTPYQVWFNLDNSLTRRNFYIFENRISEKVEISDWNTNFFSRQAIPKLLFVLHSRYPWDTPYQVWFNLDNSLTRRNFYIFEIRISEKVDISDWNTNFFLGKLYQKFFSFYTLGTHGILHTEFGSIWTTPWPDEKDLFLKLFIRKNRKFPYEKLTFFLDKL